MFFFSPNKTLNFWTIFISRFRIVFADFVAGTWSSTRTLGSSDRWLAASTAAAPPGSTCPISSPTRDSITTTDPCPKSPTTPSPSRSPSPRYVILKKVQVAGAGSSKNRLSKIFYFNRNHLANFRGREIVRWSF